MAVLYSSLSMPPDSLRAALLRRDPALDFRVWPDTGPVEDIRFALVWRPKEGDLARYPNLKAIFCLGAGVDGLLADAALPAVPIVRLVDRALTSGMTEYVLLHVLRYHRRMPELQACQRARRWEWIEALPAWERRVGILGLGVLGADAAAKLVLLGFDVAGWSRTRKAQSRVRSFAGAAELLPFLARSEILVCLLPLTADTQGILNARTLAALPKGAALVNAARGGHVVEPDLLAALDSGHLAYATLDVFQSEPLPPASPFWSHPKVTVTPHNASDTNAESSADGLIEGMREAEAGRPLKNLVDRARGY